MEQLEICMCYGDNDYDIVVDVTEFEIVKGSYQYDAPSSDDYYGYDSLDYDIISITTVGEDGTVYQHPITDLREGFTDELYQRVWDYMVDSMEEVD